MSLSDELLDILVCPVSKEPMIYFEDGEFLFCPESRLKYPVKDDIPQMLEEEAESLSDDEAEKLEQEAEERNLRITGQQEASAQ